MIKLDNNFKDILEELSKNKNHSEVVSYLKSIGFNKIKFGTSAMVFINYKKPYVIKIGDKLDRPPNKNSKFHKFYAKILFISKNRKILVQERVFMSDYHSELALNMLSKKLNMTTDQLTDDYDIFKYNVGILRGKPKIIDYFPLVYTESKSKDIKISVHATWYKEKLEEFYNSYEL